VIEIRFLMVRCLPDVVSRFGHMNGCACRCAARLSLRFKCRTRPGQPDVGVVGGEYRPLARNGGIAPTRHPNCSRKSRHVFVERWKSAPDCFQARRSQKRLSVHLLKHTMTVDVLQVRVSGAAIRSAPGNTEEPGLCLAMNGRETTDASGHSGEVAACFPYVKTGTHPDVSGCKCQSVEVPPHAW
jgi:hypothetical protein